MNIKNKNALQEVKDQAGKLCYVIEELPASPEQTELSIQASELFEKINTFKLSERWFYLPFGHFFESFSSKVGCHTALSLGYIEVPTKDVEYVRDCIDMHIMGKVNLNDFEFKNSWDKNASLLCNDGNEITAASLNKIGVYCFVRKQPAEVKQLKTPINDIIQSLEEVVEQLKEWTK